MPKFETPEPISVTLEVGVAEMHITASERTDTVVDIRPTDESDESDVRAAQQVTVDYANGQLQVTGPRIPTFDFSRKTRSVDVVIELPAGSRVNAQMQVGDVHGTGRLGETRVKTSAGNIRLEQTGPLHVSSSAGHVSAEAVAGNADISTAGKVRLGTVEGSLTVKNSNGETTVDAVTGDLRVRASNGAIQVERAGSGVDAKTSNGEVRIGEVVRGSVELASSMGDLQVGIAEGTAAWLDVNTGFGHVRNQLTEATRPEDADETVEVRGRTSYGDVVIHRS